jgi:LTXXQ motif family protein
MGMWGNWRGGRGPDWMLERIEGRLAYTKTELKITDAQNAAWNQLADAIRTAAKHHNERMKGIFAGNERSKTLPERVEAQEQFMSVRVEEIKLIKTALKNLYAVLSDEQKKEADEVDIPMVGRTLGLSLGSDASVENQRGSWPSTGGLNAFLAQHDAVLRAVPRGVSTGNAAAP